MLIFDLLPERLRHPRHVNSELRGHARTSREVEGEEALRRRRRGRRRRHSRLCLCSYKNNAQSTNKQYAQSNIWGSSTVSQFNTVAVVVSGAENDAAEPEVAPLNRKWRRERKKRQKSSKIDSYVKQKVARRCEPKSGQNWAEFGPGARIE